MKVLFSLILTLAISLTTGAAEAQDATCSDTAYFKVLNYDVNNEGQKYAVDFLRTLFFVVCYSGYDSTYSALAVELTAAIDQTKYAYQLASKDDVLREPTKSAFKDMLPLLERLLIRMRGLHSPDINSEMRLRLMMIRLSALLGS